MNMKQAALLLLCVSALAAQPPKMPTVLYGASYYHEYMPYERLDKDVELRRGGPADPGNDPFLSS